MHNMPKMPWLCSMPLLAAFTAAPALASDDGPSIAPIDSSPGGQSYGRWAAAWWQWALGAPADVNPLSDTTGEHCGVRQVDKVWFLAGFSGTGATVRNCVVPAGEALFFPLINNVYGAFLNDSPESRTEAAVRKAARCTVPAVIQLRIDGRVVPHPRRYFTGSTGSQSPFFNVQLPPGNFFGLTDNDAHELLFNPTAEQGYYIFLRPLRKGHHDIRWTATGCTAGGSQDITYHLTVK